MGRGASLVWLHKDSQARLRRQLIENIEPSQTKPPKILDCNASLESRGRLMRAAIRHIRHNSTQFDTIRHFCTFQSHPSVACRPDAHLDRIPEFTTPSPHSNA